MLEQQISLSAGFGIRKAKYCADKDLDPKVTPSNSLPSLGQPELKVACSHTIYRTPVPAQNSLSRLSHVGAPAHG